MCPWSLLTILNFKPLGGRQTQRYFNVSPTSSCRGKKRRLKIQLVQMKLRPSKNNLVEEVPFQHKQN